ncbi:MAG: hypothetical protein RL409_134 [Gemmatimonadota bacterium]|jgi:hypothetical protein
MEIDRQLALRAGGVQLACVLVLGLATGLAFSHQTFEDWGWLIGPGAWLVSALITARLVRLDYGRTLLGAVLAGIPSGIATLIGLHWLGALIALILFALWCGWPGSRVLSARTA